MAILTGAHLTSSIGSLRPDVKIILSGSESSTQVGFLGRSFQLSGSVALTGEESITETGYLILSRAPIEITSELNRLLLGTTRINREVTITGYLDKKIIGA